MRLAGEGEKNEKANSLGSGVVFIYRPLLGWQMGWMGFYRGGSSAKYFTRSSCNEPAVKMVMIFTVGFTYCLYYDSTVKIISSGFYKTGGENGVSENHFYSST